MTAPEAVDPDFGAVVLPNIDTVLQEISPEASHYRNAQVSHEYASFPSPRSQRYGVLWATNTVESLSSV